MIFLAKEFCEKHPLWAFFAVFLLCVLVFRF